MILKDEYGNVINILNLYLFILLKIFLKIIGNRIILDEDYLVFDVMLYWVFMENCGNSLVKLLLIFERFVLFEVYVKYGVRLIKEDYDYFIIINEEIC